MALNKSKSSRIARSWPLPQLVRSAVSKRLSAYPHRFPQSRYRRLADSSRTILLTISAELAISESAKDNGTPCLGVFALQRVENLLCCITHADTWARRYLIGSKTPASTNPFLRRTFILATLPALAIPVLIVIPVLVRRAERINRVLDFAAEDLSQLHSEDSSMREMTFTKFPASHKIGVKSRIGGKLLCDCCW